MLNIYRERKRDRMIHNRWKMGGGGNFDQESDVHSQ
jgi:hypothetical protein